MTPTVAAEEGNPRICDAAGCNELATQQIEVDAGRFGTVTLFVCKYCVEKFLDDEGTEPSQTQILESTNNKRRYIKNEGS
jgi:hypothetical protein